MGPLFKGPELTRYVKDLADAFTWKMVNDHTPKSQQAWLEEFIAYLDDKKKELADPSQDNGEQDVANHVAQPYGGRKR